MAEQPSITARPVAPTSRRALLAGAAALLPAAAVAVPVLAAPAASPDAELIAGCAAYVAEDRRWRALHDSIPDDDEATAAVAPIWEAQNAAAERLCGMRATTAEGIAARAQALHSWNGDFAFSFDDPERGSGMMLAALMRDAAALGGLPAGLVPPSPDAALLAACAEFDALERRTVAVYDAASPDDPDDALLETISEAQEPFLDAICAARPVTMAGHRARASSLALYAPHLLSKNGHTDSRLVAAIVRDLAGDPEGVRNVPLAEHPDAKLLVACAEFHALHAAAMAEDDDDRRGTILGDRHAASDRVHEARATTEAGRLAKARLALVEMEEMEGENLRAGVADFHVQSAWSALRDMVGEVRA